MIRTGSKVIILASSLKSGIGPRRGSVGYVSKNPALKGTNYNRESDCFAQPIQVTFTRYGFEKVLRKETKFFINLVPFSLKHCENMEDIDTDGIDALVDRVSKIKTSGAFWDIMKNRVTSIFGRKNVHIGIAVPIFSGCNLRTCPTEEFEAWVESFLSNHEFHQLAFAMVTELFRLRKTVDHPCLMTIRNMLIDKGVKRAILPSTGAATVERETIINTIVKIMAIGTSRAYTKDNMSNQSWLKNKNMSRNRSYLIQGIQLLLENFYSDVDFAGKVNIINAIQGNRAKFATCFIAGIRKRLLCLGQALESQA